MELSTFDILLLFMFAIAVSLVIGVNVLYIVDKKLNDIQINVPACPIPVCPKPICYPKINPKINPKSIMSTHMSTHVPTQKINTQSMPKIMPKIMAKNTPECVLDVTSENASEMALITMPNQIESNQTKLDRTKSNRIENFMSVGDIYTPDRATDTDLAIDRPADHDAQKYTDPSMMYTTNALVTNKPGPYSPADDVTSVSDDYQLIEKTIQTPLVIVNDSSPTHKQTLRLHQGYMNNEQTVTNDNTLISPPNSTTADLGVVNRSRPGDRITYPSADDVTRYNGYGCYQNIDTRDVRQVNMKKTNGQYAGSFAGSCRPYTDNSITEGAVNSINASFLSPLTNDVKDIKSANIRFHVPKLYMGRDPYISGVSYAKMSIGGPADIDQIGSIPINDYDEEPVPVGAFV